MAVGVPSTTATLYIPHKSFTPKDITSIFSTSLSFCRSNSTSLLLIKSSSDFSAETSSDIDFESSIDVPKGPPSLISVINVEKALRGIPITDVDHYGRLGIQRGCSNDEVSVAYSSKTEELKKQDLDEEEFSKKMEFLNESYTILSSVEERRLYDWSLLRSTNTDRYAWPFEVDPMGELNEPSPPQEVEDVRPTRWVGYGLLGWLILSIALSIAFNR